MSAQAFLQADLPALVTATLAALVCALVGNFLVLRRESLLGDAISHAVLPGIVMAFALTGTRATLPVFIGAAAAALLAAVLIRLVQRLSRLESGASMGVVFTVMFALGVVLLEQTAAKRVDLDPDCVLYGQLETVLWPAAVGWASLADPAVWLAVPREPVVLAITALVLAGAVTLFWKELKIVSFDPALAATLGIPAGLFQYGIVFMAALASVTAFEAVGSILVVALLICPAATARLLTDRYGRQIGLSLLVGASSAVLGYGAATALPPMLDAPTLNAAGTIATVAGLFLGCAAVFGPKSGLSGRLRRSRAALPQPASARAEAPVALG